MVVQDTGEYVRPFKTVLPARGNHDPEDGVQEVDLIPDASDCDVVHEGVELGAPPEVNALRILTVPDQTATVPGQLITGAAASVIVTVKTHDLDRSALSKVIH